MGIHALLKQLGYHLHIGENYYLYKKTARILPLAFVDDLNGISKCGIESLALNTFINTQVALKKS